MTLPVEESEVSLSNTLSRCLLYLFSEEFPQADRMPISAVTLVGQLMDLLDVWEKRAQRFCSLIWYLTESGLLAAS